VFFSYAHITGGDFDDNPNQSFHDFFDDIGKMLYHLTNFRLDVAFADVSLRTGDAFQDVLFERLAHFQVFVPILSLRYFESEWCGREWAAFEKRCEKMGTAGYPPIVPILWNGLGDLSLPRWFTDQHLFDDPTHGPKYRQHGMFGLQLLHADHYRATVYDLARRIGSVAKSADLPDGEPDELRTLPPRFGGSA
jgi:hypothetical protein